MEKLYAIKISAIWEYIKTQDLLFWLVNIYLFLEYVRPQALYPAIDVIPYAQIVILWALFLSISKGNAFPMGNPASKLLLVFFFVIVISSVLALNPNYAFASLPDFITWMLIYFLIIRAIDTKKRFFIFLLAFLIYNFKMSQFAFLSFVKRGFAYSNWGGGGGPGWFHNSGEFGIEMCIFLPLAAYFFLALKKYWPGWKKLLFALFPLTAISGTISSSSRGAVLGAACVLFWMLIKSQHKIKGFVAVLIVGMIAFSFIPPEQLARFEAAGSDRTSTKRLVRWEKGLDMAAQYPLFGVGYKNWGTADKKIFAGSGELSHNIFIECMSELGYVGLGAFLFLIIVTLTNNHHTRKLAAGDPYLISMAHGLDGALIGFIVSGFFVTVLYYPFFWINLSMTVALNTVARKEARGTDVS